MDMSYLYKERGHSFEDIIHLFDKQGVAYQVRQEPGKVYGFFRASEIEVALAHEAPVARLLGVPDNTIDKPKLRKFYRVMHQPLPGFDWRQVDGTITLEKGKLVERTTITIVCLLNSL